MINEALRNALLEAITDDYTGLWEIVPIVAKHSGCATEEAAVKGHVLEAIRELLDQGQIRLGSVLIDGTFEPWVLPVEASITRILNEWSALGRQPDIGEIVWFDTPPST